MAKITNNLRSTVNFVVGMKDGAAVTEAVKAGETKVLKVDLESPHVKGLLAAGAISIDDEKSARAVASSAS